MTVHISIGNSDDKLSQAQWSAFAQDLLGWVEWCAEEGTPVHGVWYSEPSSPWQNMCVALDVANELRDPLRYELRNLAAMYGQDSIAWLEGTTEFLSHEEKP